VQRSTPRGPGASQRLLEGSLSGLSAEQQRDLVEYLKSLWILAEAADHPELRGMGTTVTMAFHLGAQLCVVHVGDSRAYLYRDDELHRLTQERTLGVL
jgi:serine/threonine protein phosphatase PrpC